MPATPSLSLSSENEVKKNPYQVNDKPGPQGAYEARQVMKDGESGFYVRVDMPGVPPEGVKLVKYGETRKVTFTGKAPKLWECDSSDRVYGGYVVLDRDPTKLDVEMSVKNGCLRLFFPSAEGTLHSLPSRNSTHEEEFSGSMVFGDTEGCCHDQYIKPPDDMRGLSMMRLHSRKCSCNKNGSGSETLVLSHINPFLLQGVEGVYENKLVADEIGERLYIRMDMPGLEEKRCIVVVRNNVTLFYGGDGRKEHHLDEGGRSYLSSLSLLCPCCKITGVRHEMKHGVLRLLITKINLAQLFRCSKTLHFRG